MILAITATIGVDGNTSNTWVRHAQFSILNSETLADTLHLYKALILAEQTILSPRECDAIRRFFGA